MFMIELLSGGIFTVYAVNEAKDTFLIYRDSAWQWIGMDYCKPYTYPYTGYCTTGGVNHDA